MKRNHVRSKIFQELKNVNVHRAIRLGTAGDFSPSSLIFLDYSVYSCFREKQQKLQALQKDRKQTMYMPINKLIYHAIKYLGPINVQLENKTKQNPCLVRFI